MQLSWPFDGFHLENEKKARSLKNVPLLLYCQSLRSAQSFMVEERDLAEGSDHKDFDFHDSRQCLH